MPSEAATLAAAHPPRRRKQHSRLGSYFQEAARLRLCLAYNLEDFKFAQRDGRVVYLVDANIVRFFMDPESESSHVIAFKSRETDYASATALITAEFLFSRELAGQKSSPCFIAPAHGDEVGDLIEALAAPPSRKDLGSAAVEEANRANMRAMLRDVINRINKGENASREEAAEKLRQIVPSLADLLLHRWAPAIQLGRLYDKDLVRPLALNPAATQEILWPDRSRVREWAARIEKERRAGGGSSSKRNERDAEALLQVMMLDEAAAVDEDAEATKYVMVTADTALYNAYAKWFWNEASEPEQIESRRFVLRDPLQYAPILNTFEMPNGVHNGMLSELATDALDSLFANLRSVEASFPQKLAYYRILAEDEALHEALEYFFGGNPLSFTSEEEQKFLSLREDWHKSFRTGILLNINLMHRRLREEFDDLMELLQSDYPLRQSIEEDQQRSLARIQYAHAAFSTQINVMELIEDTKVGTSLSIIPRSRIPFLLRPELMDLPPEVQHLLQEELSATEGEQLNQAYRQDLEAEENQRTLMLAAAVAYRCGHWSAGRIYARQALSFAVEGGARAELEYILASCIRSLLASAMERNPTASDVQEAEQALDQSICHGDKDGDEFAVARALVERVALIVTLHRRAALMDEPLLEAGSGPDIIIQADRLETLLVKIADQLGEASPNEQIVRTLLDHAAATKIGVLAMGRLFGEDADEPVDASLERLEGTLALGDEDGSDADTSPLIRCQALALRIARRGHTSGALSRGLESIAAAAQADLWLSDLDRAEIERLCQLAMGFAHEPRVSAAGPRALS